MGAAWVKINYMPAGDKEAKIAFSVAVFLKIPVYNMPIYCL